MSARHLGCDEHAKEDTLLQQIMSRELHFGATFCVQESWEGGADAYRGGDGPLGTQTCKYQDPLLQAFADEALSRCGRCTEH